MWETTSTPAPWLRVSSLKPTHVLDEYDEPRIFTVVTDDGQLLLSYLCAEERSYSRFLLVPADEKLVANIESNLITLRDALTGGGWAWLIDRHSKGGLTQPVSVDVDMLPPSALPKPGVRLSFDPNILLRVRLIGSQLDAHRIPASVVRRALDGATGAVRALSAYALEVVNQAGRPADDFRRYYDLPAVDFGFRSFEIAFGHPDIPNQLQFEDQSTLEKIRSSLEKGLAWVTDKSDDESFPRSHEWESIIEALSKLTPPLKGPIEKVEVSGSLAGRRGRAIQLTRRMSERVSRARKSFVPDTRMRTYQGYLRELDKDKRKFILRNAKAEDICVVGFSEEQFDDVSLAFETDQAVSIVIYESVAPHELTSITFGAPREPESPLAI